MRMIQCKWEDCVSLKNNDIIEYYKNKKGKYLYFIGKGFDPRMCEGISLTLRANKDVMVYLLEYEEGKNSSSHNYAIYVQDNYKTLQSLTENIQELKIEAALSRLPIFLKKNLSKEFFKGYDRIIVDISSMPQIISFNLIKHIIQNCEDDFKIDIITCENSAFDDVIIPTGLDETANYLNGFSMFSMEMESEEDSFTVWLPLLGKNCKDELEKIYQFISPNEICPVLPFPSEDAKKSDEILSAVGELLFTSFEVEKRNILYIPENNVIQAYKKLCSTVEYYNETLNIIGKTKFIFTIGSSKLIGIGALLANMEISKHGINTSFAMVENDGYIFSATCYEPTKSNIYCVCLNDSIYDW